MNITFYQSFFIVIVIEIFYSLWLVGDEAIVKSLEILR